MKDVVTTVAIDEDKLKDLLKAAIVEVFKEQRELLYNLLEEALEDIALVHAIEEGKTSNTVSQKEVFEILEGI